MWDCDDQDVWTECEAAHDGIVAKHWCRETAVLREAAAAAAMKREPPRFDLGDLVAVFLWKMKRNIWRKAGARVMKEKITDATAQKVTREALELLWASGEPPAARQVDDAIKHLSGKNPDNTQRLFQARGLLRTSTRPSY